MQILRVWYKQLPLVFNRMMHREKNHCFKMDPHMFVDKHGTAPTRTTGWEVLFHFEVKSRVRTLRCKNYVVCTDIAYVMAAGSSVFQSWSSTDDTLHRAGKQSNDSLLNVCQMEFGCCTVFTPSTGHGNINRMACVHMRCYVILLQNLVT